ncbi:MAG: hypothetical protein C5B49_11285 [Bdellovibrio sp.]|nr:MAG: hypothetical protein C5B49_11285 [Bdellovibrio sp.]
MWSGQLVFTAVSESFLIAVKFKTSNDPLSGEKTNVVISEVLDLSDENDAEKFYPKYWQARVLQLGFKDFNYPVNLMINNENQTPFQRAMVRAKTVAQARDIFRLSQSELADFLDSMEVLDRIKEGEYRFNSSQFKASVVSQDKRRFDLYFGSLDDGQLELQGIGRSVGTWF